ncbi:hypothetical protein SAMN04487996_102259 [Dyadobacter soli]|uniref:Uncharacterized protein n=1 Tax=Dyadobacter soli TaxID=659014 RepID=A0A1G6XW99_9BACT|nr:hypothetical protein [Dyadobacter soli]SDD81646.1 hypothetical protein SAMN04487996_102259 [Dyadobacter soli]
MKKFILHTLIIVLTFLNVSLAQDINLSVNFPKTYTDAPCLYCTPPGYTVVAGGPVSVSNVDKVGGYLFKPWINSFLPPPSFSKAVGKNNAGVFLTLDNTNKVKAEVSGFEIGANYTLHYYVMTARADINVSPGYPPTDYATSANIEVKTVNGSGITSKTTTFVPGSNVEKWIEETLTFTAPSTSLVFYLSGASNAQQTSLINFDIDSKPFDCVIPGGQVALFHGGNILSTPFPCETTNLYNLITSSTPAAPAGVVPVWGVNPNSSYTQLTEEEAKTATAKAAGKYYYAFYKSPGGCYNTPISTAKATFPLTPAQVSLTGNQKLIDCITQMGVDLTAQVASTNYKVHWFKNDQHQGLPIDNPQAAPVGIYYAFYFDSKNKCYSVDKANTSAMFSVGGSTMCCNDPNDPSNEVPLLQTDVKIIAPAQTYDLTQLVPSNISLPPNVVLEWYTTANHTGSPIADPTHVGAGKYYVFGHDTQNGCFNTQLSKSSVNVSKACNAGSTPVALKQTLSFYCEVGEPPLNLNDFVVGAPPAGLSVVWYTNDQHTGNPIPTPTQIDYLPQCFAFFYDNANQCFSPPQVLQLQSKQVPTTCPYEDGCQLSTCVSGSVNLNAVHSGPIPNGWELRWYSNRKHTGQQVATPNSVTEPGDYYPFYYNTSKQCYNKSGVQVDGDDDFANKKITVSNQACAGPQLDVRVVLQGARLTTLGEDIMHNNLQTYYGFNSGLLPTVSPYGDGTTSPTINNTGIMSNVVDWVKVEIRDAVDPSILLESKSLILFASGSIGNVDGTSQPTFASQSKPVRIVIKHRNHLSIMSNPIQDFSSGVVSYDFTNALSQASNDFGSPDQMVQKNGIWCMRVGDLNLSQDFSVNGVDGTYFNVQFKSDIYDVYDRADLNMNGFVDGVDGSLFNINFYLDIYSTLINY